LGLLLGDLPRRRLPKGLLDAELGLGLRPQPLLDEQAEIARGQCDAARQEQRNSSGDQRDPSLPHAPSFSRGARPGWPATAT